MTPIIAS